VRITSSARPHATSAAACSRGFIGAGTDGLRELPDAAVALGVVQLTA
jgi:hypothetical protein